MPRIERILATEVIVPARPGTINSPGIDQPLHKLPVAGRASWSVQFDELPKCILEIYLDNGAIGLGELYRDHDWRVIENISRQLIGTRLGELPRQKLPIAHCRPSIDQARGATRSARLPDRQLAMGNRQSPHSNSPCKNHRPVSPTRKIQNRFPCSSSTSK